MTFKQKIETHTSFSQRGIPGGKRIVNKDTFSGSCTDTAARRAGTVAAIQAPGDDILIGTASWRSQLEEAGPRNVSVGKTTKNK